MSKHKPFDLPICLECTEWELDLVECNCPNIDACDRAYNLGLKDEHTAARKVVGDETKHYICAECEQSVDPWDKYCRWCGGKLVDE